MKHYYLLILLLFGFQAHAMDYFGEDLSSWPQTESRKVANDFAGWLLVTPNLDWQERWDTPPETTPYFDEAETARVGDRLVVLTFFANPGIDASGNSLVKCSLQVTRPDGSIAVPKNSFDCLNGKLPGNPRYVRLSPGVVQFIAEETDPKGVWVVDATLEDAVRGVTLDLKATYELVGP
jgi:hypothetical protein